MTIYFQSRTAQRAFKSPNGVKTDKGANAPQGKRWAFEIQRKA